MSPKSSAKNLSLAYDAKNPLSSLWSKIGPLFSDFYDYILGDYLKGIFGETSLDFDVTSALSEIRKVYLRFWKKIVGVDHEQLLDPKFVEHFQGILEEYLSERLSFPFFLQQMVCTSISNMSVELITIFNINEPSGSDSNMSISINTRYMHYLQHLVEEYVLVNYFDQVILAGTIKILMYTEHLSYAQIYEMRINLLEMFREFLFDTKKYEEFLLFFENTRSTLKLTYSIDLTENLVLSFLISLANNKQKWDQILSYCKKSLLHRTKLIKTNLQMSIEDTNQVILRWVEQQLQNILSNDAEIVVENPKLLIGKFCALYEKLISRESKLAPIQQQIQVFFKDLYGEEFHKRNRFTGNNTQKMLISLATLIDSEVKIDPTLENFASLIQKMQKESLPGGNEFYI